ncbi:MAG: LLM class F420-dependent oxidoreductase [Mycobacterium sp.]|nr:LLM class F420-dependent oxidoreductase [Mycobacterium sp.]
MAVGIASKLKIDGGISSDLRCAPQTARDLEREGFDGCWTGEINHDPFLPMLLAAEHSEHLDIGTSIAVAFARSPMTVANLGWDLQSYSQGRFILGLGTQIQPHIEKRFSMPWSHPVRRMHEFIMALQAIWNCWEHGTKLNFEGEFYTHRLMTPMFTPEPHPHGPPAIFLAAVGERMTEMCGEAADGLLAHAFTTCRYLDEVTIPTLQRGLQRSGRAREDFVVACPVFLVTGTDEASMATAAAATRKQIAFYASTPAYRPVLELHGWGDLQTDLRKLSLDGRWDEMGTLIDDEMLAAFAVVAPAESLAPALWKRCTGAIDRVMPAFPAGLSRDIVTDVLAQLRQ